MMHRPATSTLDEYTLKISLQTLTIWISYEICIIFSKSLLSSHIVGALSAVLSNRLVGSYMR